MRILSQDGTKDIPYEIAMIEMQAPYTGNNTYNIYTQGAFIGANNDYNFIVMAKMSKAKTN